MQELARAGMAHDIGWAERQAIEEETDVSVEAVPSLLGAGRRNLAMGDARLGGSGNGPVRAGAGPSRLVMSRR